MARPKIYQSAKAKIKKSPSEEKFYNSFTSIPPKPKAFAVGQTVEMQGSHPWAGHKGEVVAIQNVMGKPRPRIRLFDTQDHEVFAMNDDEARILK